MKQYLYKTWPALSLLAFILSLVSCNDNKTLKYSRLNKEQELRRGEWLDPSDTLNGISIRGNKIAFFKKMNFTGDQIFEYYVTDSIYKIENVEKKTGEFLFIKTANDPIIYSIVKRNQQTLILKDTKEIPVIYNFWR